MINKKHKLTKKANPNPQNPFFARALWAEKGGYKVRTAPSSFGRVGAQKEGVSLKGEPWFLL